MKRYQIDGESLAIVCVIGLALILVLIRACIPLDWHRQAERPATPPESFYTPKGE